MSHADDTAARSCACTHGAACDGPVRTFRRAEKLGAAVVTDQPSHWESIAPSAKAPQGAYTGPLDWSHGVNRRGDPTYRADSTRCPDSTPTQGQSVPQDAPSDPLTPRLRAALAVLQARQDAPTVRTTVGYVAKRNRRSTLNTTVRGFATTATDIAELCRSRGIINFKRIDGIVRPIYDTAPYGASVNPNPTRRERRALRRARRAERRPAPKRTQNG